MSTLAQIGFYAHQDAPVGQHQTLLLMHDTEKMGPPLVDIQYFFGRLFSDPAPSRDLDRVAAALAAFLMQQGHCPYLEQVDALRPDIDRFYKISLEASGWLEVFDVRLVIYEERIRLNGQRIAIRRRGSG